MTKDTRKQALILACAGMVGISGCYSGSRASADGETDSGGTDGPGGGTPSSDSSNPGTPEDTDTGDTQGDPAACTEEERALQEAAATFFEGQCTSDACHGPIGPRLPYFGAHDMETLVAAGLVEPGDPDGSRVFRRIATDDPTELMPPTRDANTASDIETVRAWIEGGAPTRCDVDTEPLVPHPNSIPQDLLFTCEDASANRSSPARVRRIDRDTWTHGIGGVLTSSVFLSNPFVPPSDTYSTFPDGQDLGPDTFGLYLNVMERALEVLDDPWYRRPGAPSESCIENLTEVDEACREQYVHDLLLYAALFREPTPSETALMYDLLDSELAHEPTPPELADRFRTLDRVTMGAWLLPGALFRSELGNVEEGERRRLDAEEAVLAVTAALTTYPVSEVRPATSYGDRPELGWLPEYREKLASGALDDVDALREFVGGILAFEAGHVGGSDGGGAPGRLDLQADYADSDRRRRRGEYWLAPEVMGFFREYFEYGDVSDLFKEAPIATSRWTSMPEWIQPIFDLGYEMAQSGRANSVEPLLREQLDDAIARAIVEGETGGTDAFSALMRGRTWRVPAAWEGAFTLATECDVSTCTSCCPSDKACMAVTVHEDGTVEGYCGLGISGTHRDGDRNDNALLQISRVYDVEDPIIESTDDPLTDPAFAERWMTMPADERSGVLTHPAWLSAHGGNLENDASAVLRGHWIREHLFCESVGSLGIVQLEAQLPESTHEDRARDRLHEAFEGAAADARCSNGSCHALMNSLGMPFEIYNHAGFLREDDHGHGPDGSSTVDNWPQQGVVEVSDALELTQRLAEDPYARRCFIRHVFRYFMRRYETTADACTLSEMEAAFESGSFMSMLETLMTSDTFLYRTLEGGQQ